MRKVILLISLSVLFSFKLNSKVFVFDECKLSESKEQYLVEKENKRIEDLITTRRNVTIIIIARIESNFNHTAFNPLEEAAGMFQIRPVMVREVNRLLGCEKYSLNDRYSISSSIDMFVDYNEIVNPEWDYERAARLWNGGITGMKKKSTDVYWSNFLSYLSAT